MQCMDWAIDKSSMVSINVPDSKMTELASAFGCVIGSMPFTYLGLPMGTTKPRMEDLTPLMDRVERRLTACSNFLSYSGRLQMVNSVITPTVTYTMCSIKLPIGVIENIDRIRKQCLWRGNDATKKGGNLAAWTMVQKPKHKGGLGVLNLRLQNDALLKQLHKFYNHSNIPWVQLIWHKYYLSKVPHASSEVGSFWWKDLLRLNILYRGIAKCSIGDGSTVSFWEDLWASDLLSTKYPRLFSFARDASISVQQIVQAEDLESIFHLPLSAQAHEELVDLQLLLQETPIGVAANDSWSFIWGNPIYSSRRYYQMVYNNMQVSLIFKKIWSSKCMPRIKFFAWLIFVDRLNTRSMLSRRNYIVQPNLYCVLCDRDIVEDLDHLFFKCDFATACWQKLDIQWPNDPDICNRVQMFIQHSSRGFSLEIFLIAAWELWNLRNSKIFDNNTPTIRQWVRNFKKQGYLQLVRVKEDQRASFISFIETVS